MEVFRLILSLGLFFQTFVGVCFLTLMSVQRHLDVKREKKAMATGQSLWSEKAEGNHTKKEVQYGYIMHVVASHRSSLHSW